MLLIGTVFLPMGGLAQDDEEDEADDETEEDEIEENETEENETDDRDDDEEDEEKRKLTVEREGNGVEISLERESGPSEDEVKMAWKADDATFELEHESENQTREIENKLEAKFGALAEYRDGNDNGRYDPGEEIVSGYALGDELEDEDELNLTGEASWQTPSIEDVTVDGKDGKKITSTAELGDNGTLTLRFLVFGDFVDLNGTSLSPTGAKIDIIVDQYDYQDNGTALALFLETKSENEFEQEIDDDDETGVAAAGQVNQIEVRLVFTWKDSAEVDGSTESVATTVLEEETETETEDGESSSEQKRSFALSYPRGEKIVHDPKAEVQTAALANGAPAPGLIAALATLAAVAVASTRWRGRR